MTVAALQSGLQLNSIDDYLGPGATRFFGSGYRRVSYGWHDLEAGGPSDSHVRALAAVRYPTDWSKKQNAVQLRPHLSTIDAMILGVRSAELCLLRQHELDPRQRCTAWLRKLAINAASAPYEDGLDQFQVEARLNTTIQAPNRLDRWLSTFDGRVANMNVRSEIEHPLPDDASSHRVTADSAPRGLYGEGYRHTSQSIEDIKIHTTAGRAEALVRVDAARREAALGEGLEAYYRPSVSPIDSFVVSLQLGQVLLYEMDRMTRADSNTLWMRHTIITTKTPYRPADRPFAATVHLEDARLVNMRGASWRTATIVGDTQGIRTRCAVAHQLTVH
jgi:hypothetical protein